MSRSAISGCFSIRFVVSEIEAHDVRDAGIAQVCSVHLCEHRIADEHDRELAVGTLTMSQGGLHRPQDLLVGHRRRTVDAPVDLAHALAEPSSLTALLDRLSRRRCFVLRTRRAPHRSIDRQYAC